MQGVPEVAVLRLGHRPGRDERMTTHVGLTARAFGADRVILPTIAGDALETVESVTTRFGGPFEVETVETPRTAIRDWAGRIVHLSMYGERLQDVEATIRAAHTDEPLLIVVGGGKVAFSVYEAADWNVAVTNQPHSEVAALSVFLDHLFEGAELGRQWLDAEHEIIPQAVGKRVEPTE